MEPFKSGSGLSTWCYLFVFQAVEGPFLAIVEDSLADTLTVTLRQIYSKTINFILSTLHVSFEYSVSHMYSSDCSHTSHHAEIVLQRTWECKIIKPPWFGWPKFLLKANEVLIECGFLTDQLQEFLGSQKFCFRMLTWAAICHTVREGGLFHHS